MLRELRINNIILIEKAELKLQNGLAAFSGETGAGKTALLQAMRLLLGSKTDPSLIRNLADKGSVNALFEVENSSPVLSILADSGIEVTAGDDLIIHREINLNSKNRIYINNQPAQLNLLKKLAPHLIDVVEQHASQKLLEPRIHKEILDHIGNHTKLVQETAQSFLEKIKLEKELQELLENQQKNDLLKLKLNAELEEIDSAAIISEDEDETLFQEYEVLSKTHELQEALSQAYYLIQEQEPSILSGINSQANALNRLDVSSPDFKTIVEGLFNISEQLTETSFNILNFKEKLCENPERIFQIEERLKLLKTLSHKYGPSLKDVLEKRQELFTHLEGLLNHQKSHAQLEEAIAKQAEHFQSLCYLLSESRVKAQNLLEEKIQSLLNDLNLPQARLFVQFIPQTPCESGQEQVEFFLQANPGEKAASLKNRASGGELSRVLLALKILLSEQDKTPTLFFDEVDANLGGETAPKVGQLLKRLSRQKQILMITHLPQVAAFADHHYQIYKQEKNERTFSLIEKLNQKQQQVEIERMLGGKKMSSKATILAQDLLDKSKA